MTWLAFRQFRLPAYAAAVALVAVGVTAIITGTRLDHLYDGYKQAVGSCGSGRQCLTIPDAFLRHYHQLDQWFGSLLAAVPALIGIFWGAPLIARELETGTYRLSWTQSVTRGRWFAGKAGVVGLATVATAGLFTLAVTWWADPVDHVTGNRFSPALFGERGVVPIGYALFAFALGVLAGLVIRHTLPAMAATLIAYVAVREFATYWLRERLLAPRHLIQALNVNRPVQFSANASPGSQAFSHVSVSGSTQIPHAWILSDRVVDSAGHGVSAAFVNTTCPRQGASPPDLGNCVGTIARHYHEVVTYQPASRFWAVQWAELSVFVAAAMLLLGFSYWWLRRTS